MDRSLRDELLIYVLQALLQCERPVLSIVSGFGEGRCETLLGHSY